MKRIGVFGGSFNPIHNGHLGLTHAILRQTLVDEIWLLVSPQNPLKSPDDMAEEHVRFRLVQKAIEHEAKIKASDFEFRLKRPSYTWKTLAALRSAHPDVSFSLIIGADNWALFDRWAHPEEIRLHHHIIVYPRNGYSLQSETSASGISYVDAPLFPFSSTDIRRAIAAGNDISAMVPSTIVEECRKIYSAS